MINELHTIIVDMNRPAMYLNSENKNAGFDDYADAVKSSRAYCIETRPEIIPVDVDEKQLRYLPAYREILECNGDPFLEVASGGLNSPNRHFYVLVPDIERRKNLINQLKTVGGAIAVRVNQKIRPPYTPHRDGLNVSTPINENEFISLVKEVLV